MTIRIALHHETVYSYDRLVSLSPQTVRLRPAPHSRTPVRSYSLKIEPADHFINWQQDPHSNYSARLVFPKKVREFRVEVDLIADMAVINPFDFFTDEYAEEFPFQYEDWLAEDLRPFLRTEPQGELFDQYLQTIDREPRRTVFFLVDLNQQLERDLSYLIRMEPGVQTPEETLAKRSGSCRDSAWLLVQLLRHCGLAARFVSGYLVQLKPDVESLDGPSGAAQDFTDLHAWTEVYLPGAGWVGLDPTSGLLAGEGHIPLACTPNPTSAAPITGGVEECETEFRFDMSIARVHEDPRVTKPYTDEQWQTVLRVGDAVDARLDAGDVRLTMGGEPTFVSIDDMEGAEWSTAAVGPMKRGLALTLIQRLGQRFGTGGFLHYGQGKWYPGESLPRWAFSYFWRTDSEPIWSDGGILNPQADSASAPCAPEAAEEFTRSLAESLGVGAKAAMPAYEDVWDNLHQEQQLPVDVDPLKSDLEDPEERQRLARVLQKGLGKPAGYVLPLQRQWWQAKAQWVSGRWPLRNKPMLLIPGDSPIGLRLPLDSLPETVVATGGGQYERDPIESRRPLPTRDELLRMSPGSRTEFSGAHDPTAQTRGDSTPTADSNTDELPSRIVQTALCVEVREGRLHVFMPPVDRLEDYLDLLTTVESAAVSMDTPVVVEGYLPPNDQRLNHIKVTPDPGVIEVNIHPAHNWREMVDITETVYEEARLTRLGTEKFQLDGRHAGTGGGNHFVLGGKTPAESPFLRRPDLLQSLIAYWNNHPSLSYLFSGLFIGPTSQAPRVDEGRRDALYELELAFSQIPLPGQGHCPPWLVDRVFRHLLTDLTGNTHRAEFCIDKLYSPDSSTGRLGLLELRGFEMPPHAQMSLTQQLLVRALVAKFWESPYRERLVRWDTALHDRFMLPHMLWRDFSDVITDLQSDGFEIDREWFAPHFEFRCPFIGDIERGGIQLELRQALEPWYVLGEEPGGGGTARYVDSSVERLQVKVTGMTHPRHTVLCNGREVPLHSTGTNGEYIAGVRYRAWQPPSCLHPTIPMHTPLTFDLFDTWQQRSLGGCKYHVDHPGGLNPESFPVNALEAESRRASRFFQFGHTGGEVSFSKTLPHPNFPFTLDLRTP